MKRLPTLTRGVLVASGCVVNQLLRAEGCHVGEATVEPVMEFARRRGLALHLLPCPETILIGLSRPPRGRAWYEEHGLRDLCRRLASEEARKIDAYRAKGVTVVGVVGIERSPACSTRQSNPSPYYPSGIFMEELRKALTEQGVDTRFVSVTGSLTGAQRAKLEGLDRAQALAP